METSLSSPKFVPVEVRDDSVDPRKKASPRLERPPGPVNANERVLGQVPRIGLVLGQAVGEVVRRLAVFLDRPFEERGLLGRRRLRRTARDSHYWDPFAPAWRAACSKAT